MRGGSYWTYWKGSICWVVLLPRDQLISPNVSGDQSYVVRMVQAEGVVNKMLRPGSPLVITFPGAQMCPLMWPLWARLLVGAAVSSRRTVL
jgi:hypothetical protein